MRKKIVVASSLFLFALVLSAKEPVIMNVNGEDVAKTEFEYLYGKNNKQQLSPQSLDDYVDMFKLYKLKVADAKAEGIDTLESFKKEMMEYRRELAAPYLADSAYLDKLIDEAYDWSKEEVESTHIMMFKTKDAAQNIVLRNRLDSIRTAILNGADFSEMAIAYSQDKGSSSRGGNMGYIVAGRYPYSFEKVAYNLPEGEISEIVESPVGYHVLKGGKHRKARGKVQVAHILRMARGNNPEVNAKAKAIIDSIYDVVSKDPEAFADLAQRFSEDGSSRQGGNLPWFGAGEMVAEFDSVAFAIPVNTISKPFRTAYGWHIIKKLDSKDIPTLSEMKPTFLARVNNPQDERFEMIRANQNARLAKIHKSKVNNESLKVIYDRLDRTGIDSLFIERFSLGTDGNAELFSINGVSVPVKNMVSQMKDIRQSEPVSARKIFDSNLQSFYNEALIEAEEDRLYKEEPAYRNLLKEYIDGSLLYEVSVKKVWDPASKDVAALDAYFKAHKDNYKWDTPRVKGYLVKVFNDSIGEKIKEMVSVTDRDSLISTVRKNFQGKCTIEKILVEKGLNPTIDYLAFGGEPVASANPKVKDVFLIDSRILNEPEELNDVKGLVTSDYQNLLQRQWEDELRKKYPVKVYKKVLKSVKK